MDIKNKFNYNLKDKKKIQNITFLFIYTPLFENLKILI